MRRLQPQEAMHISLGLREDTRIDWRSGRILNANLADYRVPESVIGDQTSVPSLRIRVNSRIKMPLGLAPFPHVFTRAVITARTNLELTPTCYIGRTSCVRACSLGLRDSSFPAGGPFGA